MPGQIVSDSDDAYQSDFELEALDDDIPTRSISKKKAVPGAKKSLQALAGRDERPVEEVYQKKSQLEHILLRPDTYIGSVERVTQPMWVYDSAQECMTFRPISFVPGLFKIFDEILVNAADNKIRDPQMDTLRVDIDRATGRITVQNNGRGIPVEMHATEGVYVPELIFGHLLTSSNYNDDQKKVTGGRNGYGAKLCNIFSTEFTVETADLRIGKKFHQTFTANMSQRTAPSIVKWSRDEFTRISFIPDLAKFGMDALDDDLVALFTKRVYDLAGVVRDIKVFLNGERIKIRSFRQYVDLFVAKNEQLQQVAAAAGQTAPPLIHAIVNDRWEICCTLSDGQFNQVSFVNGINTYKGGTHVSHVADQIVTGLVEAVKKKNKAAPVKPFQVRNHLFLFVNCLIENPTFDSQTKEHMTLRASAFGSRCEVGDDFMKRILRSGVVESILSWARSKQDQLLKKTDGAKKSRLAGIAKLDDANNAGTRQAAKCTLILTEGDSAKALAVSGLSVVGRDNWGVFPLRGKLLNVREASHKQIMENAEINHIKQILGLQHGRTYESAESLRYGRLMIMTDQDHDGSHIKGLLINLLDHFWPSLLRVPGFLVEFITPIVRCTRARQVVTFFTIPEYEHWKAANGEGRGWTIKYYKGLGTSTSADAKAYFSDLSTHLKPFEPGTDEDRALIDLAFNKRKADDRKDWLRAHVPGTHLDHAAPSIALRDFINRELILFSLADNIRSLPSLVDGLKPGQRKILFACFKRRLRSEIKVAQLAGYVAEHSAYHHGEQSLCATIVGLAQSFVGSNNIPLLEPNGQFGTRLQGGRDAASPRYIFTLLSPLTRLLFRPEDDALLRHLVDDGQSIEPDFYCPILPMVLVNGGEGIGTGWSTFIPNYNPLDVVDCLLALLADAEARGLIASSAGDAAGAAAPAETDTLVAAALAEEWRERLHPWYRGFTGTIDRIAPDRYRVTGSWRKVDNETIEITELPVGTWTQNYKEMLEGMLTGTTATATATTGASASNEDMGESATAAAKTKTNAPFIKDYREYHTDTTVRFVVTLSTANMAIAEAEGIARRFRLTTTLTTSNLVCFDAHGRLHRFTHPLDLLLAFFPLRMQLYQRRKAHLAAQLTLDWQRASNRVRFISEFSAGRLVVQGRKKAELVADLVACGYEPGCAEGSDAAPGTATENSAAPGTATENSAAPGAAANDTGAFDYLLNMPISSLTLEKATALQAECAAKEAELAALLARSPADLWRADLAEFRETWTALLAADASDGPRHGPAGSGAAKKKRTGDSNPNAAPKKTRNDKAVPDRSYSASSTEKSLQPVAQSRLDSFLTFKTPSPDSAGSAGYVDGGEELPLAERIQRMLSSKTASSAVRESAPMAAASTGRRAASKKMAIVESDDEEEEDEPDSDAYAVDDEESAYESEEESEYDE